MDQYFTEDESLLDCISYLASLGDLSEVLEPSCGKGDIVKVISKISKNITCIEIDDTLWKDAIHDDYLTHKFDRQFTSIVGNPPFSLATQFIERSFELLQNNAQLIFIIPSDTFRLTRNCKILSKMTSHGKFTHIVMFQNTHLFKGANISVQIFRYVKSTSPKRFKYAFVEASSSSFDPKLFVDKEYVVNNGILSIGSSENSTVSNYFSVYVGYVCGCEKELATENEHHSILILKKEGESKRYYDFQSEDEVPDEIAKYKSKLISRKIGKFDESNWFIYGLKRNSKIIEDNRGRPCLYMYMQTRNDAICFEDTVKEFGGNLLMLLPLNDSVDLNKFKEYFNSSSFKSQFITDGNRFRIGHKQLLNAVCE